MNTGLDAKISGKESKLIKNLSLELSCPTHTENVKSNSWTGLCRNVSSEA